MSPDRRVFIIDDEQPVRASLARLLRAIGVPNETFASAEEFLANLPDADAGCLLVDVRMPGMSGLDLLEELNRRQLFFPAVVMTGHTDAKSVQRLDTLQPLGFLEKPFSLSDLKGMLERWRALGNQGIG
jgi:two-component system, LuxR family, response regulator FixJ